MTADEWRDILADDPGNELVRFSMAKELTAEKRWTEAASEFAELVARKPDFALAWSFLARARLAAGDRDGARRACAEGMPVALKQRHEVPTDELQAVLDELDSEF